jgi:hypothetical protein
MFLEIQSAIKEARSTNLLSGGYRRGDMIEVRTGGSTNYIITSFGERVKSRAFYMLATYLQDKL